MKDWVKILNRVKHWHSMDQRIQAGLNEITKAIAPGSYSPINEILSVDAYIDGIGLNKEQEELISWWLYEVPDMEAPVTLEKGGIKWDAKDIDQFIDFLNKEYGRC